MVCQRERRGDVHVNAEPLAGADVCRAAGRVQLGAAMAEPMKLFEISAVARSGPKAGRGRLAKGMPAEA